MKVLVKQPEPVPATVPLTMTDKEALILRRWVGTTSLNDLKDKVDKSDYQRSTYVSDSEYGMFIRDIFNVLDGMRPHV